MESSHFTVAEPKSVKFFTSFGLAHRWGGIEVFTPSRASKPLANPSPRLGTMVPLGVFENAERVSVCLVQQDMVELRVALLVGCNDVNVRFDAGVHVLCPRHKLVDSGVDRVEARPEAEPPIVRCGSCVSDKPPSSLARNLEPLLLVSARPSFFLGASPRGVSTLQHGCGQASGHNPRHDNREVLCEALRMLGRHHDAERVERGKQRGFDPRFASIRESGGSVFTTEKNAGG